VLQTRNSNLSGGALTLTLVQEKLFQFSLSQHGKVFLMNSRSLATVGRDCREFLIRSNRILICSLITQSHSLFVHSLLLGHVDTQRHLAGPMSCWYWSISGQVLGVEQESCIISPWPSWVASHREHPRHASNQALVHLCGVG
jgi:hypothetical protein